MGDHVYGGCWRAKPACNPHIYYSSQQFPKSQLILVRDDCGKQLRMIIVGESYE
jgi:hypothetical protein